MTQPGTKNSPATAARWAVEQWQWSLDRVGQPLFPATQAAWRAQVMTDLQRMAAWLTFCQGDAPWMDTWATRTEEQAWTRAAMEAGVAFLMSVECQPDRG